MNRKYIVALTKEERKRLCTLTSSGNGSAHTLTHACILLKVDSGPWGERWTDVALQKALDASLSTILRVRQRFVKEGLEAAINRRPSHRICPRKLDSEKERRLIALVYSPPPKGYARWTLRLLASKIAKLKMVNTISHETIRQVLKEATSAQTPHLDSWLPAPGHLKRRS